MKRSLSLLLAVLSIMMVIVTTVIPVSAASTTNAYSKLSTVSAARTYTIKASGQTIPYTNKNLTTRGTTNGAQSGAYIDNAADEIYIFSVGKNSAGVMYAYISYPGTYNRVNAYVKLTDLINTATTAHRASTAQGKFYLALRSGDSTNDSYWVDKGDPVYLLSPKAVNGKYQIMAPRGAGGYRIAWCRVTDYNKYCNKTELSDIPATSITLDTKNFTLRENVKRKEITAKLQKYDTTDIVTWSSSNTKVAKVNSTSTTSCMVNAVANGTAVITAKTTSGKTATVMVTVKNFGTAENTNNNSNSKFVYSMTSKSARQTSGTLQINGNQINVGGTFYTYDSKGNGTYTSTNYNVYRYVKINNKYVDVGAVQCLAYVRYLQELLYGCNDGIDTKSFNVKNVQNEAQTTENFKKWITDAGAGAHLRVNYDGHSMMVIGVDSNGFYYTDANNSGSPNRIAIGYYTWSQFKNAYTNIKNIKTVK